MPSADREQLSGFCVTPQKLLSLEGWPEHMVLTGASAEPDVADLGWSDTWPL